MDEWMVFSLQFIFHLGLFLFSIRALVNRENIWTVAADAILEY